jgi:hypothetical protein
MNGPHDKFDFLPDSSALTTTEDLMSRRSVLFSPKEIVGSFSKETQRGY